MTGIVAAFVAVWKGTEIATWIINAGGLIGIFNKLTAAIKAATIAKIADKAVDIQIIALYAKDFVVASAQALASILRNTAAWIASTAAKVANTAAQWAQIAAVTAWNAICAIATVATTAFGAAIAFLTSPIGIVTVAIIALVTLIVLKGEEIKMVLQSVDEFLQGIFVTDWTNVFGPILGGVLNGFFVTIKSIWESIKTIFNGIIDFVQGVFSGNWQQAWQGIQNIFSGIFGGLVAIAKAPLNAIIGLINGVINAVNGMIDGLNDIDFDVPDWVPVIGGESFGLSIPHIPNVPYLAQGAVLPPNRPFLAMVGDQTSGTNVEAPLDTIKQALAEVMATGGNQDITIKFAASGGLAELVRVLKPYIDKEETRVGARLISGGTY